MHRIRFRTRSLSRLTGRLVGAFSLLTGIVLITAPGAAAYGAHSYLNAFSAFEPTGFTVSPQSYTLPDGGTVPFTYTTSVTNTTGQDQTTPLYFSFSHVLSCDPGAPADLAAECGGGVPPISVATGANGALDPTTFDHNANWRFTTQQLAFPTGPVGAPTVACSDPGAPALPACLLTVSAHGSAVVTFVGTVSAVGYYQVDVGSSQWPCVTQTFSATRCVRDSNAFSALSASLIRVLPEHVTPTPTPSATPSPSPSPSPSPTPAGNVAGVTSGGGSGTTPVGAVQGTVAVPDTGAAGLSPGPGVALLGLGLALLLAGRRRRRRG